MEIHIAGYNTWGSARGNLNVTTHSPHLNGKPAAGVKSRSNTISSLGFGNRRGGTGSQRLLWMNRSPQLNLRINLEERVQSTEPANNINIVDMVSGKIVGRTAEGCTMGGSSSICIYV
jgi:hypothetical protein